MPGLFEQFPHTNLHELNLDWIIDMINQFKEELEDSAVLSVNGQTGHVTLYESENVILPALPEGVDQWRLVRMMNGQNIGILFYDGNVWLQRGNTNLRLLTRQDLPETGVLSWNGQTGVVVANGATIIRSTDDPVSIDQAITTETTERTNQDNAIRNTISAMSQILADTPQNATQMPMSASDTTTVSEAIKAFVPSINLHLNGIGATIHFNNNSRHLIIISGAGITTYAMVLVNVSANGSVGIAEIHKGTSVTLTSATNELTYSINTTNNTNITIADFAVQGAFLTAQVINP